MMMSNKLTLTIISPLRMRALGLIPLKLMKYKIPTAINAIPETIHGDFTSGNNSGAMYSAPNMATSAEDAALLITVIQFTIKANAG